MSNSSIEENISTHYIPYPKYLENRCISCNSKVKFVFPSAGHIYQDFSGYHKDIFRLYFCSNPFSSFHKQPFNPFSINLLPYKQYFLAVWKWIAQESKILKQNPIQIHQRIKKRFEINILENTVKDCINVIDVYLSSQIDKKTREILKK